MGEWKTIDTAPIGEWVLVCIEQELTGLKLVVRGFIDSKTEDGVLSLTDIGEGYPTHWMPLPDAPTNSKEGI